VTVAEDKRDVTLYAVQYELLRAQVIGPSASATAGPPRGLGLALFLNEGMPGWMNSVAAVLKPPTVDSAGTHHDGQQPGAVAGGLSGAQRSEISTILASLILSTLPAHTSPREAYR
jgi:hypothetical protein